jgi:hypothetical protein
MRHECPIIGNVAEGLSLAKFAHDLSEHCDKPARLGTMTRRVAGVVRRTLPCDQEGNCP